MEWNFLFFMNSVLLGVGLAMDAFSVSLANGMNEKNMKKSRMAYIAGVYAFFQFLMPMIGWICVHTIVQVFGQFQKFIPWIALILLLYIGGSMIKESMQSEEEKEEVKRLSFAVLMMQGIATSIDALSVGFTTAGYGLAMAVVCSLIVAVVTFVICETGLCLGNKAVRKGRCSRRCNLDRNRNCVMGTGNVTFFLSPVAGCVNTLCKIILTRKLMQKNGHVKEV